MERMSPVRLEDSGILGRTCAKRQRDRMRRAKWIFFFFNFKKEKKKFPNPTLLIFLGKHFQQGHKCTGSIDFWLQTTFQAAFKSQFLA